MHQRIVGSLSEEHVLALVARLFEFLADKKSAQRLAFGAFFPSSELHTIAQRLMVAHQLVVGHSYRGVRAQTGASFQTIARMDRWLRAMNPHYRKTFPLRHRRSMDPKKYSPAPEYGRIPFSMKQYFRDIFGADIL